MRNIVICSAFLLYVINQFVPTSINAQPLTQVVKGKIVDEASQTPLPGATVVVLGTDPILGTVANESGNFRLEKVPLGRYNIRVEFLGYEPAVIPEILITSGKEMVLNISLKESISELDAVVVKAQTRKDKAVNTMASISAKSFTVEETSRYAGAVDDPARMVSAFAGVTVGDIQDNAIIIRGNSPKGVLWRVEGVEVSNPNHFAGGNVAGGGIVSILSAQLLASSDFYTGAFPAEYGNAMAGVFDMKLRAGNSDKHEHTFQAGVLGIDFASEGPFKKGGASSYLFNYRYSTFSLLCNTGIIPTSQIPQYQDLSFKLNFPTRKAGTFSLWGIGGMDFNEEPIKSDSTKWVTQWSRVSYLWYMDMGATGLNHVISLGENTYLNTSLVATGLSDRTNMKIFDDNMIRRPYSDYMNRTFRYGLHSYVNHKFSARHTIRTGVNLNLLQFNIEGSSMVELDFDSYRNLVKENGSSYYGEYFFQSKYNITNTLTANTGVNAKYFVLNKNYSIDPRLSLVWDFAPSHSLSVGYGKHSQLEDLNVYLLKNVDDSGIETYPNKNLELAQAHHIILAYDWLINSNKRLRIEPYYQYLYNVPGVANSNYSMLNFRQEQPFDRVLENNSMGENIGVDVTFEHFLHKNFYYLATVSLFESKYKGDDGVWRNTRYNKGFVTNFLFGYEFFFNKRNVLGINVRANITGGERRAPIDYERSMLEKQIYRDETKAFEYQNPTYWGMDVSITYRNNSKRFSSIWGVQVKNALGAPMEGEYYNLRTNKIEKESITVVIPVLSYKIEF